MTGRRVSLAELAAHCRRMAETDPIRARAPAWLSIADELDTYRAGRHLDLTFLDVEFVDDDEPPALFELDDEPPALNLRLRPGPKDAA